MQQTGILIFFFIFFFGGGKGRKKKPYSSKFYGVLMFERSVRQSNLCWAFTCYDLTDDSIWHLRKHKNLLCWIFNGLVPWYRKE